MAATLSSLTSANEAFTLAAVSSGIDLHEGKVKDKCRWKNAGKRSLAMRTKLRLPTLQRYYAEMYKATTQRRPCKSCGAGTRNLVGPLKGLSGGLHIGGGTQY